MILEPSAAAASRSSKQNSDCHAEATYSGAVSHSEEDSGNENRQKSARRRKRAHSLSENGKSKTAKAGCSSGGGTRGGRVRQEHVETVTLFEVITMGKTAIQAVIDDWIEAYLTDRDTSLLDLISFFIQCSGCKGVVTAEMCQSKEDRAMRSKMVEELDEGAGLQFKRFLVFPWILTVTWPMDADSAEYPLVQSGPSSRWFHSEFCEFVSVLVTRCQHSVMFDSYLMNNLISLLTELSDSRIRAFRHTCTLAAVKLQSSLAGVALSLSVGIENNQKLYEVQRTKSVRSRSAQQLERIQNISEERRAEIEGMMDAIFKGVFLKRYRDMLPEIRSICMEELGLWMKLYSSAFLNDSNLKYLGWMMHDKVPDVRLKCVLGLQGLYSDPVLLPKLDLFTSRFKDRLISMTLDKDNDVEVQAMKLLVLISNSCEDVLTPDDYKQLLPFVYSSHRPLAAVTGELLFSRIVNAAAPASDLQGEMSEEEAQKQQTLARLKALLQFYQESELHEHVAYLVDSLWDCGGSLLKDWPALTAALLQNSSSPSAGGGFTPAEQAVIVEILVASARQASEGPALPGRSGAKKVMSVKEKKVQTDDCLKFTEHLLRVLPQLLSKFSCSCDIITSLMRIPQFFLPDCPETGNAELVSSLISEMAAVLDLYSDPAVLEAASRSYLSLCGEGAAWCCTTRTARDSLVQRWVDQLTELLGESLRGDGFSADEGKTREIVATLKKLRAFYNCHDLGRWSVFDLLSPLLTEEGSHGGAPAEVLEEVLQCLSFSMIWSLNMSSETLTCREKAVAQRLQLRVFCEQSHRCLSHSQLSVRHQAFLGVCDVLMAHSYQIQVWDPTSYGPLLYTPSPRLQRALLTFACAHVFVDPDSDGQNRVSENSEMERLEDLHRRRNMLAAFCKLIVHGVLEMSTAAEVYTYYMKYNNDFGDIIKEMMFRTRQINKMESARTLGLCLQQLFVRLKQEQSSSRAQSRVQTFTSIKELARRFALTFGDLVKFRECVVMIHRTSIEFVFREFSQTPDGATPPFLSYLTILSEFSSKLLKPDKKTVFSYLLKHTAEHIIDLREECWQPLIYYRASLLAVAETEDAGSHVGSDRRPNLHSRSPFSKQKLEGSKSPCQIRPIDKVSKVPKPSTCPNQQMLRDMDPFAVPLELQEKSFNTETSVLVIHNEPEDGTVEVEL